MRHTASAHVVMHDESMFSPWTPCSFARRALLLVLMRCRAFCRCAEHGGCPMKRPMATRGESASGCLDPHALKSSQLRMHALVKRFLPAALC